MLGLIFLGFFLKSCLGQFGDPSITGLQNKPILRMGADVYQNPAYIPSTLLQRPATEALMEERANVGRGVAEAHIHVPPPTTEGPKEPAWVDLLRNNIRTAVRHQGYLNSKDSIKDLIENADLAVNGNRYPRNGETVTALRVLTDRSYNYNDRNKPILRSKWEPRWETDLKNYIKGLIGQYGKSHLDDYVRPVVDAIESSNNVVIRDIDVNPYSEVSVNWKPVIEGPSARSAFEFERRPDLHQFIR